MNTGAGLVDTYSFEDLAESYRTYRALADENGWALESYEGGSFHITEAGEISDYTDFIMSLNRDPRMSAFQDRIHDTWVEAGGELIVHFADSGVDGWFGNWSTYDSGFDTEPNIRGQSVIERNATAPWYDTNGRDPDIFLDDRLQEDDPDSPPQPSDEVNELFGDAGDNPIQGTVLDDRIEGFGGNDKIFGGLGDDYIIAGSGQDGYVRGGAGADLFQFGPGDQFLGLFDFELGVDKIVLAGGLAVDDFTIKEYSFNGTISTFFSTADGDRLRLRDISANEISEADFVTLDELDEVSTALRPDDYDNQFFGDADDNPFQGTTLGDWITGGAGNDKINGMAGDGYIAAGSGRDGFVRGGDGADIFEFGTGDDEIYIFDFKIGVDQIALRDGLSIDDLTASEKEFNGINSALYVTDAGDRLRIRDISIDDLSADDFIFV